LSISNTLIRVLLATAGSAIIFYLLLQFLPFSANLVSIGGIFLGLAIVTPFIWPELHLLLKLGENKESSTNLL